MTARIAVITPYHRETVAMLRQCHDSIRAQQVAADHIMIADGHPLAEVGQWPVLHMVLPRAHGDNGNTPRGLASLLARRNGYEFIAYCDADNWFHPGHLASLLALNAQSGRAVCTALRSFHALSGAPLPVCDADEDALRHVDTSCFLIHRTAFALLDIWLTMPPVLSPICDRVFLAHLLHRGQQPISSQQRSVAFRCRYAAHYRAAGVEPPPDAKPDGFADAVWTWLRSPQGIAASVESMGFWPLAES